MMEKSIHLRLVFSCHLRVSMCISTYMEIIMNFRIHRRAVVFYQTNEDRKWSSAVLIESLNTPKCNHLMHHIGVCIILHSQSDKIEMF